MLMFMHMTLFDLLMSRYLVHICIRTCIYSNSFEHRNMNDLTVIFDPFLILLWPLVVVI